MWMTGMMHGVWRNMVEVDRVLATGVDIFAVDVLEDLFNEQLKMLPSEVYKKVTFEFAYNKYGKEIEDERNGPSGTDGVTC